MARVSLTYLLLSEVATIIFRIAMPPIAFQLKKKVIFFIGAIFQVNIELSCSRILDMLIKYLNELSEFYATD